MLKFTGTDTLIHNRYIKLLRELLVKFYTCVVIFFLILQNNTIAQTEQITTGYYNSAIRALENGDTSQAEYLFKKSIKKDSDSKSYFELAKLLLKHDSHRSNYFAYKYLNRAFLIDPKNTESPLLLAEEVRERYPGQAYKIYKQILEIDDTNIKAINGIGKYYTDQCREYSRFLSYKSQDKYGELFQKFYDEGKSAFEKTLDIDKNNYDAKYYLAQLYFYSKEYKKGIKLLNELSWIYPNDKNAFLLLGLFYKKTNKDQLAYDSFENAILLMDEKERDDFTTQSVKKHFIEIFDEDINLYPDKILENKINDFWKGKDPLFLTTYNERLLEHYARVTYSNLFFEVTRLNIPGWETDRGETYIRYGNPLSSAFYPRGGSGESFTAAAELWQYTTFTLGFEDKFHVNNFRYNSSPNFLGETGRFGIKSPIKIDTELLVEGGLRTKVPEEYVPEFEGPALNVDYNLVSFRNPTNKRTDLHVNYALNIYDGFKIKDELIYDHTLGIFFLDANSSRIYEHTDLIYSLKLDYSSNVVDNYFIINSKNISVKPDTGLLAFEIIRKKDKAVSANRTNIRIKDFTTDKLNISDVVAANNIFIGEKKSGLLQRDDISILPNLSMEFNESNLPYIYFEVYNLSKGSDNLTEFEQNITIRKIEDNALSDVLNSFLDIIGIDKDEQEITLSSRYNTTERNPQIYLQLDLGNYEPGEYVITVSINDIVSDQKKSSHVKILWK